MMDRKMKEKNGAEIKENTEKKWRVKKKNRSQY